MSSADSGMADVVVVGGGHNGLVCATYLAQRGLKVTLLERRHVLGGACVTEELWKGFKNSRASYVCGLFRPCVLKELNLDIPLIPRHPGSFTPIDAEGHGLILGNGQKMDCSAIAQFSQHDAQAYVEFERVVRNLATLIDPLLDVDAADMRDMSTLRAYGRFMWGMAASGREDAMTTISMLLGSARNQLGAFFESEIVRSTLATDALIGTFAGPSTPATGYVLVHHMMGGGSWGYVKGGMGSITSQLETKAREKDVSILTDAEVVAIDPEARRVILRDGNEISFKRCCVSNLTPSSTMRLLSGVSSSSPQSEIEKRYINAVKAIDYSSPVMKINLALDSIPRFHANDSENRKRLSGTIHIGATTLDDLDDSYKSALKGELPSRPMIEMTVPSVLDGSLAPPGKHVCSLFIQHVPPTASEEFWIKNKDSFADHCIKLVEEVSPGFSKKVLHRECLSPRDLERVFGLEGGNIFHGAMTLDRMLFARPVPAYAFNLDSGYATPWKRLFLCGAGTHPGGGVMGACGRNAALAIIKRIPRL